VTTQTSQWKQALSLEILISSSNLGNNMSAINSKLTHFVSENTW